MTALYIILGVAALFAGLLCIPLVLRVEYAGSVALRLRWLFLTVLRVPAPEGKKPRKKKKKKEKPEKEKKKEDKPKKEKEKKPSAFQRFYQYQGLSGFLELLRRTVDALKKFRHGLWYCFRIRELRLHMVVMGGEPQELVEKYGKACAAVYPSLGWLSTHLRSRPGKVRATIAPDFTGLAEKEVACTAEFSVVPLVLLAAVIMLLLRLGIQVALKFLSGAKPPKEGARSKIQEART
ncbi:MAG: hypothetical protein LBB75_08840 [Oscillospiraceae bacterium]|jgi:hypothetical protein|nr:hypothetical protein [Oscillospiraceae bacterium]